MTNYKEIFVESFLDGYPISIFTESELKFILSKDLIKTRGNIFIPAFVGELVTPENSYFSLPKNFNPTESNVELFKKVLSKYKDEKGTDGKTLLTNNSFTISDSGEIKSEKFYYNELKEFFLDFITYEYIYPKKTNLTHSTSTITGGKIDVLSTIRNRQRKGPGITYKTKDIENSKEWNIDDIYWSTIANLSKKYATEDDIKQISEMKEFLLEEGFIINEIDISNKEKTIQDIRKCDVGIIHQSIKNTLLDFFDSKSIGERFSINAFYTLKFQYVWEELVRECLKNGKNDQESKDFKKSIIDKFNRKEIRKKRFPNRELMEEFLSINKNMTKVKEEKSGTGIKLFFEIDIKSIPDVFSSFNNKRFIGDAKYYRDPENADFEKEYKTYNTLTDNKYPMVVFVPQKRTKVLHTRAEDPFELVIFHLSVEQAITDSINGSNETIEKVHTLLYKNTDRQGPEYLGNF